MTDKVLKGIVLDERTEVTITELCHACTSSTDWVLSLVDEGVLEPVATRDDDWRFSGTALRRALTARRLQRDLGVNLPGIALALDMLDEIETLRARLRRLDGSAL